MNEGGQALRVVLCSKRDLAGAVLLNRLLPRLAGDQVMVLLSDKTRPVENIVPELATIKYLERDLPVDTLFPLLDRDGHDDAPLATFAGLTRRFGAEIRVVSSINDGDGWAALRDFGPDLVLSARFSLIFRQPAYALARLGTYNIHPGALPRYGGLFAPFRALLEGQDRLGCTLHRIDDGIDTGPVVDIGWLDVDPRRSLLWHVVNTYSSGLDLFVALADSLRAGHGVTETTQDPAQRRYGRLPDAQSFAAFRAKGWQLFEAEEYRALVAGFVPAAAQRHLDAIAAAAAERMGTPCCCAPA